MANYKASDEASSTKSVLLLPMNLKEIKELIQFLREEDIAEFELERGDVKVRIKRGADAHVSTAHDTRFIAVQTAPAAAPAEPGAAAARPAAGAPAAKEATAEEGLHSVRSPIVGTFYESPSPGSPPFVKPGDVVEVAQLLCIVE